MSDPLLYLDFRDSSACAVFSKTFKMQNNLDSFKICGQPVGPYDTTKIFIDVPSVKDGGNAHGGPWQLTKPGDEQFLGEPGQKIPSHAPSKHGGYDRDTSIGDDGRATAERHYTDHGFPGQHSDPHDHMIDWSTGFPKLGPPINYLDGAPKFKVFRGYKRRTKS